MAEQELNRRVLVVDDNGDVLDVISKVLDPPRGDERLDALLQDVLGQRREGGIDPWAFEVRRCTSGSEAIASVRESLTKGLPFAVAFVDVRMPPGPDGIETVQAVWELDPDVQVVICSAYSDYSWAEMAQRLPRLTQWLVLKKPFSSVEVIQCAHSLAMKWHLDQLQKRSVSELERELHRCVGEMSEAPQEARRGQPEWQRDLQLAIQETQRCIEHMRAAFEGKL